MPELPEVESFKKYIDKTSIGKQIELINLVAPKMLINTTEKKLKSTLVGNVFKGTFRHGKFLFIELKKGGNLLLHFGLTGDLAFIKPGEEPPQKFVLRFHFHDDSDLFFTDTRKMGKIALVDDIKSFIAERGYGKDALTITKQEFIESLKKKKIAIKTVLMDQKILAGVGNEFSDEILFQAKIHPATPTINLSAKQMQTIYTLMLSILKQSVKHNADREKLGQYFFLENRKAGLVCPNCNVKTAFQTIGGRSSYFCPSCQKKY
jgi:formamidopyrimidine-DNA glycosylase